MNYNKICPYVIILKDFDWRIKLCKLQHCPVICPEFKEDCPVYSKEYNTDTSAGHLNNKSYEREKIHNSK